MRPMTLGAVWIVAVVLGTSFYLSRAANPTIGTAIRPSVAAGLHGGTDCRGYIDARCGGLDMGEGCPGDVYDCYQVDSNSDTQADVGSSKQGCGIYHYLWLNDCKNLYSGKVDCH